MFDLPAANKSLDLISHFLYKSISHIHYHYHFQKQKKNDNRSTFLHHHLPPSTFHQPPLQPSQPIVTKTSPTRPIHRLLRITHSDPPHNHRNLLILSINSCSSSTMKLFHKPTRVCCCISRQINRSVVQLKEQWCGPIIYKFGSLMSRL
ncbi:hypothetical protein HanRHA438_Chr02g0096211 [Helianthus annuus]|nr:hypothetical protein HanRHA438_Chr02g0096211 [Helianthus annuus]